MLVITTPISARPLRNIAAYTRKDEGTEDAERIPKDTVPITEGIINALRGPNLSARIPKKGAPIKVAECEAVIKFETRRLAALERNRGSGEGRCAPDLAI